MRFFELSLSGLIIRFYVMMAVVLVAGFTGAWPLALLALPIFLSGMLGAVRGRHSASSSPASQASPEMALVGHAAASPSEPSTPVLAV